MIIVIYIYWQVELTVRNTGEVANPNNTRNIILKNCTTFTDCISEANNAQIDNAKEIDIVMPMFYLILWINVYSHNYSKTSRILWQYYEDEPFLDNNGDIADFPGANDNSPSLNLKQE